MLLSLLLSVLRELLYSLFQLFVAGLSEDEQVWLDFSLSVNQILEFVLDLDCDFVGVREDALHPIEDDKSTPSLHILFLALIKAEKQYFIELFLYF